MVEQAAVTIIADVTPDRLDSLKAVLCEMQGDAAGNGVLPFGQFPTLHFARFLLLPPTNDLTGQPLPPSLVFLSDIDKPVGRYIDTLATGYGQGIDRIFGHCAGYPSGEAITPEHRRAYLRAHMTRAEAIYVNTIGRTVAQTHQEARLREAIEEFLDRSRERLSNADPVAVRGAIREFVTGEPSLIWAGRPAAGIGLRWWLKELPRLVGIALLLLILSPLIVLALPFWLLLLRIHERSDSAEDARPDPAHVREVSAREDFVAQNQFTGIGFVKPGWFRLLTATIVLRIVSFGVRYLFHSGSLTGVTTIHFARWVFLNDGRRMAFASNYDGSLESYMDDFINRVAWGLNAVFSNGMDYPRTNWLVFDGARDEQAFKRFLRVHQVPTQVWYSAYDRLTAVNIANNAAIRAGLSGEMDAAATEAWLRRL
jgi:hypothetical protein